MDKSKLQRLAGGLSSSQVDELGKIMVDYTGRAMQSLILASLKGEVDSGDLLLPEVHERIARVSVKIATATVFELMSYMEE